ncbi:MOSC domain-containing protein [Rhodovibrionaceae bacterium A322]
MGATLTAIQRFPVKSMSAESLEEVSLTAGDLLPGDRQFALAHGSTQFDANAPEYLSPSNFVVLKKEERLAQLQVAFDADSGQLTIDRKGKQVCSGKATDMLGRTILSQFFADFLGQTGRGLPKLVTADNHHFCDIPSRHLSLLNLASVKDLERVLRQPVDPRRFRANLWIDGLAPWEEKTWIGKEINLGPVTLKVDSSIDRCPATNVDPDSAQRDVNIPLTLRRGFGHIHMGIYVEVMNDGKIAVGDGLSPPA